MFHPSLILEEKRIILALKLFQIKNNLVTILRERIEAALQPFSIFCVHFSCKLKSFIFYDIVK